MVKKRTHTEVCEQVHDLLIQVSEQLGKKVGSDRELHSRCNTPGGHLPGDDEPVRVEVVRVEPGDESLTTRCSQCGQSWSDPACGLAHSIIAAETRLR